MATPRSHAKQMILLWHCSPSSGGAVLAGMVPGGCFKRLQPRSISVLTGALYTEKINSWHILSLQTLCSVGVCGSDLEPLTDWNSTTKNYLQLKASTEVCGSKDCWDRRAKVALPSATPTYDLVISRYLAWVCVSIDCRLRKFLVLPALVQQTWFVCC
jgi:hypothetical protein